MQIEFEPRCRFKNGGVCWPGITYESYEEAFNTILNQRKKVDHAVIEISICKGVSVAEVFYDIQNDDETLKPYRVRTYHFLGKDYEIEENEAETFHDSFMTFLK